MFFCLFLILSGNPVWAQTPAPGIIRVDPDEHLFFAPDDGVWYPGRSLSKTVEICNDDDIDHSLGVRGENLEPEDSILAEVIYLTITNQENVCLYGCDSDLKDLKTFVNQDEINLEEIVPANSCRQLIINATMNPNAGNEYQNLTVGLDFVFGFFAPPATSTPTPIPTVAPGGGVSGTTTGTAGGGGGTGGTTCLASAPSTPVNLLAVSAGPGQVLLSWQPPTSGTVTHYAILYGPSSGNYLYGNFNIGLGTNYVVSGLTPGVTYYFVVIAVNDCASSAYSNEASALPGGGAFAGGVVGPGGPAPGFEVLGEATQPGQIAGGIATEAGEVAGESIGKSTCFWWLIFTFLALVINSFYLYGRRKDLERRRYYWLTPVLVSVLSYFADQLMHRWWLPSQFCSRMVIFSILTFVIPSSIWWLRWRKEN